MADVARIYYTPASVPGVTNVLNYNTDYQKLAQQITTIQAVNGVSKVTLQLKKVGAPSGNITLTINTDDGSDDPTTTVITNGTATAINASTLTTGYANYDFVFSTEPNLAAGTKYHLVLSAAYATSSSNYATWAQADEDGYSGGVTQRKDATTWYTVPASATGNDFWFQVWGDPLPFTPKVILIT